ncbi:MAG: FtsX-like permease family protein [Chloroflexi bacterium]|nr:FtsX-like permease family protein [Chloroflexota bacterium]
MEAIFGIPMNSIMVVALALFLVCMAIVSFIALRSPLMFKLGVRNVPRRRGQTVLIVVGLMLSTLIISAAFSTGDTLSYTVKLTALKQLGTIDETIKVGQIQIMAQGPQGMSRGSSSAPTYFPIATYEKLRQDTQGFDRIDGLLPSIGETVPLVDLKTRQNEPRATVSGFDSAQAGGLGELTNKSGHKISTEQLGADEVYLNEAAAKELEAQPGDELQLYLGQKPVTFKVKDIVKNGGIGGNTSTVLVSLSRSQTMFNQPGKINTILVSNQGGMDDSVVYTSEVVDRLRASLAGANLDVNPVKQDALKMAELAGNAFTSMFTVMGLFSILAGVLLIFLIFVMLAAERKPEMGMARAIGTQRRNLIEMFLFEGTFYDLAAALVGVGLGLVVSFVMVYLLGNIFSVEGLEIAFRFTARTVIVSYCIGMLMAFIVVTVSAWRVSRLNIVAAIRDLPEHQSPREGKRGLVFGILGILAGAVLVPWGVSITTAFLFSAGASLGLIGLTLVIRWGLRRAGLRPELRDRLAFSFGGLALLVWWLLPFDTFDAFLPKMSSGIEMFFLSGVMVVAGGIWTVVYNDDLLLKALTRTLGRIGQLAPVLKTAVSYPMTYKFRTGLTLAMFALIVFTLIAMTVLVNTSNTALQNVSALTGGYDIRADVSYNNPVKDIKASIASSKDLKAQDVEVVAGQTAMLTESRQVGASKQSWSPYLTNLADDSYLQSTGFKFMLKADGFNSDREVWESLKTHPNYVVIDSRAVPSKTQSAMTMGPVNFKLEGFYLEDKVLPPTQIEIREPRSGLTAKYTIVGVIDQVSDAAGLYLSYSAFSKAVPVPLPLTSYFIRLKPGVDASQVSHALDSDFLENGMKSRVLAEQIQEQNRMGNSITLLMEGFMGLGLVVGVAALGVISMRAVVERRQEIGVLRAIGYQPGMVQLSFLLESSFITLLGVMIGVVLGLVLSFNMVNYVAKDMPGFRFEAPWFPIALIVVISYLVSLSTTFFPARQAGRIYPAEALRYE